MYKPALHKATKLIELSLLITFVIFSVGGIIVGLIFIQIFPRLPIFIRFFFPYQVSSPFLQNLLSLLRLHTMYIMTIAYCNILMVFILFIPYALYFIPFIFRQFNIHSSRHYLQPFLLLQEYQTCYILNERGMHLVGRYLLPGQGQITNFVVYTLCILVKHGSVLHLPSLIMLIAWCTLSAFGWATFLWIGGYIYCNGKKAIASWKHLPKIPLNNKKSSKLLLSKLKRCCRPIMIHYGLTFKINRVTGLNFFRGISKGVCRVLLTIMRGNDSFKFDHSKLQHVM